MKRLTVVATAGVLAVAAAAAFGAGSIVQASANDSLQLADAMQMAAVKERQDTMKTMGASAKTMAEYLKGAGGTEADAKAAAAKIAELTKTIPHVFKVKASLDEMDSVGKNRAKSAIWAEWNEFVEHAQTAQQKSAALVAAFNSGDSNAIKTAFGDLGKNGCGSCHETFRGPKVQ